MLFSCTTVVIIGASYTQCVIGILLNRHCLAPPTMNRWWLMVAAVLTALSAFASSQGDGECVISAIYLTTLERKRSTHYHLGFCTCKVVVLAQR